MTRLSNATLRHLPENVARPAYDRAALTPGIVHLGIGAFHRAHQAVYVDDCLARGETGWGIRAASLRSPDTRDALEPQDGLYTLVVRGGDGERHRIIGAVADVIVASPDPSALIAAMSDPRIRIVSLTITEKGYCHDPATGELNPDHPDIVHDLAHPDRPRSAIGIIVAALARRQAAGVAPFTLLSCDNLPANGRTLKRIVTRYASLRDADLGKRLSDTLAAPCTMVDRIVPATTDADRAAVAAVLGVEDAWPVMTEPFTQWVVEDDFPTGRPDFASVGVELVRDVAPYELMKVRLLNGAHSLMAYLGVVAGLETVADAMADPRIVRAVERLWAESAETLPQGAGLDIPAYTGRLTERFRNPALRHRLAQIAMDGSQKLPQRILNAARDRLKAGAPVDAQALAVAAWIRHLDGVSETGAPIRVSDPLAADLTARLATAGSDLQARGRAILGVEAVFGRDLPADSRFADAVLAHLDRIHRDGVAGALAA